MKNNIRIKTEIGELYVGDINSFNLNLNRIVDDAIKIDNRFQDFSYDFVIPYTRENELVFQNSNAHLIKNVFIPNQNINCKVYNNDVLLLDGLINLEGLTTNGFKCKFYSKFKDFIDTINDKSLNELTFPVISGWSHDLSIKLHIIADYKNSDETNHQYPLAFYSTYYTSENLYNGKNDNRLSPRLFSNEDAYQNYYYLFNNIYMVGNNYFYMHQLPPAIYLVSIIKQIIKESGWSLTGQFFEDDNIKKIIYMYAGDEDIYDQATETISGSTAVNLQLGKFLPDTKQSEFLQSIINYFNLYVMVDIDNKSIRFETYNTLFYDTFNPYNITDKVDFEKVEYSYEQKNNPSILFEKANNQLVFGDNYLMSGATNNATLQMWKKCSVLNYPKFFNRIGTDNKIKLIFSEPNVKRQLIWNDGNYSSINHDAGVQNIYLPLLSKQNPNDNSSKNFNNGTTGDTHVFNDEASISYNGKGSLMYYYGVSDCDFENKSGKGALSDYMWINLVLGAPIGVASPFQLFNDRTKVNTWLSGNTQSIDDRRTITASYLQSLWQIFGKSAGQVTDKLTDYSLVFDDNSYFHETLWSKFHKLKWDTYKYSTIMEAPIIMTTVDWQELQMNRPILFNNEIYSLISIEGYNPIKGTGRIRCIKKI